MMFLFVCLFYKIKLHFYKEKTQYWRLRHLGDTGRVFVPLLPPSFVKVGWRKKRSGRLSCLKVSLQGLSGCWIGLSLCAPCLPSAPLPKSSAMQWAAGHASWQRQVMMVEAANVRAGGPAKGRGAVFLFCFVFSFNIWQKQLTSFKTLSHFSPVQFLSWCQLPKLISSVSPQTSLSDHWLPAA